jgi:hypothetical protein
LGVTIWTILLCGILSIIHVCWLLGMGLHHEGIGFVARTRDLSFVWGNWKEDGGLMR